MTTTPQHKIDSGFGARTTAAEVLEGIDLTGRTAIVTGGYSGIGLAITQALVDAKARVVVPARRPATAEAAVGNLPGAEVDELDLADLDSVRGFAERFLASGRGLDILIGGAGIMATPETRVGPGWEAQFAVNHLGHFALANRLWPALARDGGARVISVTSQGHAYSAIRWDDLNWEREYDKWWAYGQSKTANVLFAVQLDVLGRGHGVRAFAAHPGGIRTPLQRHLSMQEMVDFGWIDEAGNVIAEHLKTPEQGAATAVWGATSPQLDGMGGVYLEDCDIAEVHVSDDQPGGVAPHAIDPESAARLWRISAELTGVDAFTSAS